MAGLEDAALNYMVDQWTANKGTHASLHSADPGGTGANEVATGSYARLAITWDAASGGDTDISSSLQWTGGTAMGASQAVTYVGVWDALSGGNWQGGFLLTGDTAANAAGEYTVTSIALTGSAS